MNDIPKPWRKKLSEIKRDFGIRVKARPGAPNRRLITIEQSNPKARRECPNIAIKKDSEYEDDAGSSDKDA